MAPRRVPKSSDTRNRLVPTSTMIGPAGSWWYEALSSVPAKPVAKPNRAERMRSASSRSVQNRAAAPGMMSSAETSTTPTFGRPMTTATATSDMSSRSRP